MAVDWDQIRRDFFPALNSHTYIMAASASPMNFKAYEGGLHYLKTMLEHGDMYYEKFKEDVDLNREIIARYINAKPEEIAFLPNVSSCMNVVARILEKGEFIYPSIEFPASVHIFKKLGFPGIKITHTNNKFLLNNISEAKSINTKILIHSHVQSLTGFRQDLGKLGIFCQKNHIISIINTTQSFGAFEIDVKEDNIDIMVSNTLKWVGCGYGAGILYINQKFFKEKEIPFTGWLSVNDPFSMDNDNVKVINYPRYMDTFGGCPNYGALLALKGSFDLIKEQIGGGNIKKGISSIQARIISLTDSFIEKIKDFNVTIITPLEKEFRSGIITLEHEKADKIYDFLVKNNIYVTLKRYPNATKNTLLRFSFNYYNNENDIEKVISAFKKFEF